MRASVAEHGISGSTFERVSRDAGVSRGLLHYYFGTKERLLVEVVRHDTELRIARLDEPLAAARTADEILEVLPAARQAGVRRMLVTHARSSIEDMKQMVEEGAILECIYSDITVCASRIKAVGAEHWVLATDLGQPGRPGHADGFKTLIMRMRDEGITQDQLDMMVRTTARALNSRFIPDIGLIFEGSISTAWGEKRKPTWA